MSTTVSYKGSTIATATNQTKTLLTQGKYLEGNITVTDVSSGASLGTKIITANGQYDASDDGYDGYSEIDVTVPNTYSAGDEGKVVSNGALVAQTAHADVTPTTTDQTIDTTTNNSIKVKGDADLVAGNIKKDVEIFGVTGTYEGGGGGYSDYEILTGEAPSGEVSIVLSGDLPRYAISAKKNISKLTIDMNGHGFDQLNGNANTFCNNQIPVYHLKNSDNSTRNVEGYVFSGNNTKTGFSSFILVFSGYGWVQLTTSSLRGNNALKLLDYTYTKPSSTSMGIRSNVFLGDTIFDTLIIRSTEVMPLGSIDAFSQTPFASNGTGGTLYVPADLLSSYQSASNWSTILGYANNQIKTIESTHTDPTAPIDLTTHYADGTLIPT